MSDEQDNARKRDYSVGYCKPPQEHQFKPGHKLSKGRPQGSRNTKAMMVEEWHRQQPAIVNGKKRRVSRSELGARRLATKASEGDLKAIEILMRAEAELAEKATVRESFSRFAEPGDKLAMSAIIRRMRSLREDESASLFQKTRKADETSSAPEGDHSESRPDAPGQGPSPDFRPGAVLMIDTDD